MCPGYLIPAYDYTPLRIGAVKMPDTSPSNAQAIASRVASKVAFPLFAGIWLKAGSTGRS